jgi:hypothetical protein
LGSGLAVVAFSALTLRTWRRGWLVLRRYDHLRNQGDRRPASVRRTAAALAVFGFLGLHKFYLRYHVQAIVLLLCFFVGPFVAAASLTALPKPPSDTLVGLVFLIIPCLVVIFGLVEGAIYLFTPDGRFVERHIRGRHPWF